jgi:hypothetical protein
MYTYKQARDLIIDAYFKDQIQPLDPTFCFCGTLSHDSKWRYQLNGEKYPYTPVEYARMERRLLEAVWGNRIDPYSSSSTFLQFFPSRQYEEDLFKGISDALDELKQIHIERGEIIDEAPEFTKRELV